jgi:hypothetical protein
MTFRRDSSQVVAPPAKSKHRSSRSGARTWIAVSVSVAVVVLLLTGTSIGASVQSASRIKFSAPYAGYGYGVEFTSSSGCGGNGSLPVAPDFDTSSGVGVEWAKVRATSCGSGVTDYSIQAVTGIQSYNLTSIGGPHNLTVHVTMSFIANLSASGGASQAMFLVYPELSLNDLTNGSSYVGNAGGLADEITVGSYNHEFSKVKFLGYLDFDFNRSHVYTWEFSIVVIVSASIDAAESEALSWVNMGAHGQRATLNSVVIH